MRNKKVLLSILPPWGEPSAPIGLGYISEYLLKNNIEHEIYDFNLEIFNKCHEPDRVLWDSSPIYLPRWMNPDEFKVTLNKFDDYIHEAVNKIISYGADVVAFSINLANRRISIETAQRLRKHRPGTTIIFGGPGIFIYGERSLIPENVIDIFVIGEGEATLLELLQKKVSKRALAGTAGTLTDPKTRQFIPRKAIDLSTHPWPKYTKFDIKKYPNTAKFMHILFGRGCAGRCSFCGDYSFWGRYRNRSPEDVVEEIKYHIQNSDCHVFQFTDLAINSNPEAVEKLCGLIIAEGLDIAWSSYAHLHGVTDKLARKMYDAGCRTLCFGVESGSNSTLQKMRKIHKISEVEQALSRVNNAGIACDIGLMVGFPGETEEDFQQTLKFVEKIKNLIHEIQSVSLFYVKPLSHVEDYAEQYGISFPEDNTKRWNCWIGDDGSNYQKRLQRARHLLEMIEHSQIKFDKRNFFGF